MTSTNDGGVGDAPLDRKPGRLRLLRYVGAIASVVSLLFLIRLLSDEGSKVAWDQLRPTIYLPLCVALGVYLVAFLFMGFSWFLLLRWLRVETTPVVAVVIFARSQIAKYLPTNLMHYPARILLGKSHDISAGAVTTSLLMELLLTLLVGMMLGVPLLLNHVDLLGLPDRSVLVVGLPVVLATVLLGVWFLRKLVPMASVLLANAAWHHLFSCVLIYVAVFGANALALTLIFGAAAQNSGPDFWIVLQAFSLSWVAGSLVVGAPGGLGIREGAFVFLLSPHYPVEESALVIVLFRLLTIVGECVAFGLAQLVSRNGHRVASHADSR